MHWYLQAWKKYGEFEGRSRRSEYWVFFLFNILAIIVLSFADLALGLYNEGVGFGFLSGLYCVGAFIPGLSLSVRRLHDTGRNGFWILIGMIPLVGFIVLFIIMAQDGNPMGNEYGPSPKSFPSSV